MASELRQAEHNLFRLQLLKPSKIDVADPLMPQVDIRFNFLSFGEHCSADVVRVEDEHPPFSSILCDDLSFFFNEAAKVGEPNLHSLFDNLSDRHQILGDCWNVQDVHKTPFLADMAQGNVTDMLDGM